MNLKYSKELLESVVKKAYNISDVMRKLNMKLTGGSHAHISKKIKEYSLDISHFNRYQFCKGKVSSKKRHFSEILILRTNKKRQYSYVLRRALIESGRAYECEICFLKNLWNKKELRLQIDHINRNWMDDRSENLRFICPNCHSQTEGYNGSKGLSGLTSSRRPIKKDFKYKLNQLVWRTKDKISQRKVERPSKETLEYELKNNSYLALSRKYKVSDNAIRKWCKRYGIEHRKRIL